LDIADITLDIVTSYAQGCADLCGAIGLLQSAGFDLMVIPSRGASPFIRGAYSYASALRGEKYKDFDLSAPRLAFPEEIYLPFTADIADDFPVSSRTIRHFWSRVLAAQIRRDEGDIALRFYRFLCAWSGKLATERARIVGGKDGRFIFVDTVVSGQAICEIFEGFAVNGLTSCHFVLLIDHGGAGLKPAYRQKIDAMVHAGRATTIMVDQIFTEDAGPGMSGIWSVTMPELMVKAANMVEGLQDGVGAGLYYHEVAKREDGSNEAITVSNAIMHVLLFSAVRSADDIAERFLADFKDHVVGERLADYSVTKQVADSLIMSSLSKISSTDVSRSHVVRAHMAEDDAENLLRKFLAGQRLTF
jgi:hypothetical protein